MDEGRNNVQAIEVVIVVAALLLVLNGLTALYQTLTRRRWPSTVGVIAQAVPTAPATVRDWFYQTVLGRRRAEVGEIHTEQPVLCYVYALEGFKYIANRLHASPAWPLMRNRISGLIEGEKVRVFYHPKYPHIAFLAQSYAWPALLQLALGAGLYLVLYSR